MEKWKKIEGYMYEVSDRGRVRTIKREVLFGNQKRLVKRKILKPNTFGLYPTVGLSKNSKAKTIRIHRLVAIYFIPNDDIFRDQVNHIDGVRSNNHVDNLEWCTGKENQVHASKNGLFNAPKGSSHSKSKLTEKAVLEIRSPLKKNETCGDLAKKYNVSVSTVYSVRNNDHWKHVRLMKDEDKKFTR